MIYIYDNGRSYSDHTIYFIECAWDAAGLLTAYGKREGEDGQVIGIADCVTWREPGSTTSITSLIDPTDFFVMLWPHQEDAGVAFTVSGEGFRDGRFAKREEMLDAAAAQPELLHHMFEEWRARSNVFWAEPLAWLEAWQAAGCPASAGQGGT